MFLSKLSRSWYTAWKPTLVNKLHEVYFPVIKSLRRKIVPKTRISKPTASKYLDFNLMLQ